MLIDNFYTKQEITTEDNKTIAVVKVNENHEVFNGHFPDNPVMPGVCMMQIIKELTEEIIGESLFMNQCSNVKFLTLINPKKSPLLRIELDVSSDNDRIKVKNATYFQDTLALKLVAFYVRK